MRIHTVNADSFKWKPKLYLIEPKSLSYKTSNWIDLNVICFTHKRISRAHKRPNTYTHLRQKYTSFQIWWDRLCVHCTLCTCIKNNTVPQTAMLCYILCWYNIWLISDPHTIVLVCCVYFLHLICYYSLYFSKWQNPLVVLCQWYFTIIYIK